MAKISLGIVVLFVLSYTALAIGPAPISISGFVEGPTIDLVRIHAVDSSGRMIVTEQRTIVPIDATHQAYISTLTVDDSSDLWTVQVEYLKDDVMVWSYISYNVSPWQNLMINVSFTGDFPSSESKVLLNRPNSIENEVSLRKTNEELIEGNISYVQEHFPDYDSLKARVVEQPVELKKDSTKASYLILIAFACLIIALVVTKIYLSRRAI